MEDNRPLPTASRHPVERLPEFVTGRLDAAEAATVRGHLDRCDACKAELRAWQAVAEAAEASYSPAAVAVPDALASRVLAAVDAAASEEGRARDETARTGIRAGLGWLGRFVAAQTPLVRREIWPASAVVMAIGAAISLVDARGSAPGTALALFAPIAAALGVALIYGQENDPALELMLATPTSPRLVVVARLVLVLAWDLALALAASALLAIAAGPAVFWPLVSLWLGPMLLLGCLTLLLSLAVGTSAAIGVTAALWVLRSLQLSGDLQLRQLSAVTGLLDAIWQTSPVTLTAAALLLVVAVAVMPREAATAGAAQ